MKLELNFSIYIGWLDQDIVEFSGRKWLYEKVTELGAVIHPNEYDTLLRPEKLDDTCYAEIIKDCLEHVEAENYEEELEPIAGGFLLQYGNDFIVPQCCTTAMDFENWEELLQNPSKIWKDIWIGHPWIYYKVDDAFIYFSDYLENPDLNSITPRLSIPIEAFKTGLQKALKNIYAFRETISDFIDKGDYKQREILKERLLNGI